MPASVSETKGFSRNSPALRPAIAPEYCSQSVILTMLQQPVTVLDVSSAPRSSPEPTMPPTASQSPPDWILPETVRS